MCGTEKFQDGSVFEYERERGVDCEERCERNATQTVLVTTTTPPNTFIY